VLDSKSRIIVAGELVAGELIDLTAYFHFSVLSGFGLG
jgi:hypothetical protein